MSRRSTPRPERTGAREPAAQPEDAPSTSLTGEQMLLRYGKDTVVDGVSLTFRPGQVTALVGPNGSGKSTLLRSMARLHRPDSGEIMLGGAGGERAAGTLTSREFAREVTLFSQSRPAPQGLSVREVVAFGRHPYRHRFAGLDSEDHAVINRAMVSTGVDSMAARSVSELSGGEIQRVWLAACLAQDTGVVLLDEPTNHLDLRFQIEILDLVRDLADSGVAVGIVLHDLDHAARVADSLLLMSAGTIHAAGEPHQVLTEQNISEVYGLQVQVTVEPDTRRIRIDPLGRHTVSRRPTARVSS